MPSTFWEFATTTPVGYETELSDAQSIEELDGSAENRLSEYMNY